MKAIFVPSRLSPSGSLIQRGEEFGLSLEPHESIVIGCKQRRQDLERNLAFQRGVDRAIHLAQKATVKWWTRAPDYPVANPRLKPNAWFVLRSNLRYDVG